MEKQTIILFLLLSLLFALKGMNFADESIPVRQPLRDKLASAARHFLGLPYRWGGMSERSGMDCSGLVKALFAKLNIEVPTDFPRTISLGAGHRGREPANR